MIVREKDLKMKNWLIKKLGGYTVEQVNEDVKHWSKITADYSTLAITKSRKLREVQEELRQAQLELERAENWRSHVAKALRQNKMPRHLVNKVMEMLK